MFFPPSKRHPTGCRFFWDRLPDETWGGCFTFLCSALRRSPSFPSLPHIPMKLRSALPALVSGLCLSTHVHADYGIPVPSPPAPVRVNTVGFRPQATKIATLLPKAEQFRVVRADDGKVVLAGLPSATVRSEPGDTNEELKLADFSALREPGRYRLLIPGLGDSPEFGIADDAWVGAYRSVARGFYLWRCGVEVSADWDGQSYLQRPCHLEDGSMEFAGGKPGEHRDGTGGWHDAGDYNKYVVNAAFSMGMMFRAWEHFRPAVERVSLGLPESGRGMPCLLAELKFETLWLFKMQREDGAVFHKLSAKDFNFWGAADQDRSPRFFSPVGSSATAGFAAVMALGARHFREFDAALADRCLDAARRAQAWLAAHPDHLEPDQSALKTGTYPCGDGAYRLWALQEWWETTGDAAALKAFESRSERFFFSHGGPSWGSVEDLALTGYLLGRRNGEKSLQRLGAIRANLLFVAREGVNTARSNPHGRGLGGAKSQFYWGCNGNVASQTLLFFAADRLEPDPAFADAAERCVGHLLGRNYHGRSYVTGVGFQPPQRTHDRRGAPQLPGYLVGGPWPSAREYQDVMADASRNEIAINWNASLLYALAGLLPQGAATPDRLVKPVP